MKIFFNCPHIIYLKKILTAYNVNKTLYLKKTRNLNKLCNQSKKCSSFVDYKVNSNLVLLMCNVPKVLVMAFIKW